MKKLHKYYSVLAHRDCIQKELSIFKKHNKRYLISAHSLFKESTTNITYFQFTATIFKKIEKYHTVSAHLPTVLKQLGKCETSFCSNRQISLIAAAASDV